MTIGERIRQRRLDLGLSADDVAAALGKNRATVYRYESNDIEKLPTTVLEPLAEVLKTTPAYLMGWDTDQESEEYIDAQKNPPSAESERWMRNREKIDSLPTDAKERLLEQIEALIDIEVHRGQ